MTRDFSAYDNIFMILFSCFNFDNLFTFCLKHTSDKEKIELLGQKSLPAIRAEWH
jgi:hypothetical protein